MQWITDAYKQYRMMQRIITQEQKDDAKQLLSEYEKEILPLRDNAMATCQQWTNTSCTELSDIHKMLQKYSKLRYAVKHTGLKKKAIPAEDMEGYEHLELYRDKGIKFWYKLSTQEGYYKFNAQPYIGDMVEFSTFHWALYMTNNKSTECRGHEGSEPVTYSLAMNLLKTVAKPDDASARTMHIMAFRSGISQHFTSMQTDAIHAAKKQKHQWWR